MRKNNIIACIIMMLMYGDVICGLSESNNDSVLFVDRAERKMIAISRASYNVLELLKIEIRLSGSNHILYSIGGLAALGIGNFYYAEFCKARQLDDFPWLDKLALGCHLVMVGTIVYHATLGIVQRFASYRLDKSAGEHFCGTLWWYLPWNTKKNKYTYVEAREDEYYDSEDDEF